MAIDLKLNPLGNSSGPRDIVFENLTFALVNGKDELVQRLTTRLLVFLGEWWADITRGVPYTQDILVKNPLYDTISSALKTVILQTNGIDKILDFRIVDTDGVKRSITISFECQSDDGETLEIEDLQLQV
jgi:hypothetical protein